jgi:hypothetical protein
MDVGEVALEAQVEWFRHLGARGCPQLNVPHGFGVASGLASNTENGAVVSPAILDRPTDLDQLLTWLRDRADAASVIVTEPLAPAAVTQLVRSGLDPENTGNDMGRVLETADTAGSIRSPDEIQISEITDSAALPDGFRVYQADGWWDEPEEFDRAPPLPTGSDSGPANRRATGWLTTCTVPSVRLHRSCAATPCCSFAVSSSQSSVGAASGRRLTRARLAAAAHDGASHAVLSPSPDGYHLHCALGFDLVASPRNRWFYLDRGHHGWPAPDPTTDD